MLSRARVGPLALRSLHFAAASTRASHSLKIPINRPVSVFAVTPLRTFSSAPSCLQQVAPARDSISTADTQEPKQFTQFSELSTSGIIHPTVIDTITKRMNIQTMTDVQRMTLNTCLDGTDVIAQARTGTGKTIAFLLPIIQRILRDEQMARPQPRFNRSGNQMDIRALIVSPTRELAEQIAVEARKLVANTSIVVQAAVGGTQKRQHLQQMQRQGCHILVGTPGRVNDLLGDRYTGVKLDNIETFVLDEADRLLDIGFAPAIEEMQSHMPKSVDNPRQTLMFSATVPKSVVSLVQSIMRPDFKFVRTIDPDEAPTHERIPQRVVFMDGLANQLPTILEIAKEAMEAHKQDPENNMPFKAIVYFGATTMADLSYEVFRNLQDPSTPGSGGRGYGSHPLDPCRVFRMNGGLTQAQRTKETDNFRRSESAILFSTDVTARGMDFPNVSHVIQIGLPRQPDDYIHRLGRTGRAGKPGQGWLLLNKDEKRDFASLFRHQGINMETKNFESSSLDMSRGSQVSAHTANILQMIESGVKTVPYHTKAAVYRSLLGIMPQQYPGRAKQAQVDMMNDLAKYGWGMQTPPPVSRMLAAKLGFNNCRGLEMDDYQPRSDRSSDQGRFGSRSRRDHDNRDPFGLGGGSGKGVFGGSSSSSSSGSGFGGSGSRGGFGGDRGSFGGDRGGDRRGGRGDRDRGSRW